MPSDRVSATLSEADRRAILDAIHAIREKLPFLVDLSPEERRSIPRMGDVTLPFVEGALEAASGNEGMLPRSFDLGEFRRDVALIRDFAPVLMAIEQLRELADDTMMAVRSDAFTAGLLVYKSAKLAGGGEAVDRLIANLSRRFARRPRKTRPEPDDGSVVSRQAV